MSSRVSQSYWMSRGFTASVNMVEQDVHSFSFQAQGEDHFSGLFSLAQLTMLVKALEEYIGTKDIENTGGERAGKSKLRSEISC